MTPTERTSMLHWYPLIKDCKVQMPRTEIVIIPYKIMYEALNDEKVKPFLDYIPSVKEAINKLGGYPIFIRTDYSSGKHDWVRTCYVGEEKLLVQNIFALLEYHEIADILGLPYNAIIVREFLKLQSSFKAFNGFPVNRERRYFVMNGIVQCHHPYWIPDAVEGHTKDKDWKNKLFSLNLESRPEVERLTKYAEEVGKHLDGYWSVDFAWGVNGKWYMIDAADATLSFHWPSCKYSKN